MAEWGLWCSIKSSPSQRAKGRKFRGAYACLETRLTAIGHDCVGELEKCPKSGRIYHGVDILFKLVGPIGSDGEWIQAALSRVHPDLSVAQLTSDIAVREEQRQSLWRPPSLAGA